MAKRFGKPSTLEVLAGAAIVILFGLTVGLAVRYPVAGLPLYGKTLLGAIIVSVIYYSIRHERREEPVGQIGRHGRVRRAMEHDAEQSPSHR